MNAFKKSDETRRRILDAALKLFRERGFDETSMRDIAAAAGAATGAAYYYFDSKEALVMAFYERAQDEMEPLMEEALKRAKTFQGRLRAILDVKLAYFAQNRKFLGALNKHAGDPQHPLSPFSEGTRAIRDRDIRFFAQALDATEKVPADLKAELPTMLWTYQMAIVLFWIYDRSPERKQTAKLIDASVPIVTGLIALANLPFTKPIRKRVLNVVAILSGAK